MKIFWSWQSDAPGKTGRHFVRNALTAAIEQLRRPDEVEEPMVATNRESMHLDQDRQGVTGSPVVADNRRRTDRSPAAGTSGLASQK